MWVWTGTAERGSTRPDAALLRRKRLEINHCVPLGWGQEGRPKPPLELVRRLPPRRKRKDRIAPGLELTMRSAQFRVDNFFQSALVWQKGRDGLQSGP